MALRENSSVKRLDFCHIACYNNRDGCTRCIHFAFPKQRGVQISVEHRQGPFQQNQKKEESMSRRGEEMIKNSEKKIDRFPDPDHRNRSLRLQNCFR